MFGTWLGTRFSGCRGFEARTQAVRDVGRGAPALKLMIQSASSPVRGSDAVTIELEKRQHRDERDTLVAVKERLSLGNAVGEHRRLECKASSGHVDVGAALL